MKNPIGFVQPPDDWQAKVDRRLAEIEKLLRNHVHVEGKLYLPMEDEDE